VVVARDVNAEVKILDQTWGDDDWTAFASGPALALLCCRRGRHAADSGLTASAFDPGGATSLTDGQVDTIVPIVSALAKGYSRGRGFDWVTPHQDMAAVIVIASATLAANTGQLPMDETTGSFSRRLHGPSTVRKLVRPSGG
jgi:hypothetical protein